MTPTGTEISKEHDSDFKTESLDERSSRRSDESEATAHSRSINSAKIRLAALDREEAELRRKFEQEIEKYRYVSSPPSFFIAVDLFIVAFVFGGIFYQAWKWELPSALDTVLYLVGLFLIGISFQRSKRIHRRRKLNLQFEKDLKTIAENKSRLERIVDSK